MTHATAISTLILTIILACTQSTPTETKVVNTKNSNQDSQQPIINTQAATLQKRFSPPPGFRRIGAKDSSFAAYLRNLPLKPHQSKVLLHNGSIKTNNVHEAVIDLPIGKKNLHQCADAIMRLRAEYLWQTDQFENIHFNFTNGFRVDYSKWMNGNRIGISGNNTFWKSSTTPSNTYEDFWDYMEVIFTYAGTLSLSKELKPVSIDDMEIGDVLIQGGSPGHAVLIIDMAVNESNGEKLYMLAQSYMPAQETHILKNNHNPELSPWYLLDDHFEIRTPEWTFQKTDLMRFE